MLLNSYLTVRLKEGRKWRIVSAIRWVLTAIYAGMDLLLGMINLLFEKILNILSNLRAGSLTMGIAFAVMAANKNEGKVQLPVHFV